MPIRSFQPGDEATLAGIFNAAAGRLPGFKTAKPEDVRRRTLARDFDPTTRQLIEVHGEVVGYCGFQLSGRVSFPWCLPGHEAHADALLDAALAAMRARGLPTAMAAYHAGWAGQRAFFERHGFRHVRDMLNFAQAILELPTLMARRGASFTPLRPDDVPAVYELVPELWRGPSPDQLRQHWLHNPYLPPESFVVIRNRADDRPTAVGVLVENPAYADPDAVDSSQPCFRLGAFGTEGLTHKRINGLFSFVCAPNAQVSSLGLDLLTHAVTRLDGTAASVVAAQVPSDVPHLARFYQAHFRPQGRFPVFERTL